MAWIKLQQSLREHKKIIRLAEILDMPEPHVAGHCAFLWLWCVDNAGDGNLPDTVRTVEKAAGWEGQRGAFYQAMLEVGFLDPSDDSLSVHDWEEYNGAYHDKRKREATKERVQKHRKNKDSTQKTENEDVTRYTSVTHALRDAENGAKNANVTLLDLDRDLEVLEMRSDNRTGARDIESEATNEDAQTSEQTDEAYIQPDPTETDVSPAVASLTDYCHTHKIKHAPNLYIGLEDHLTALCDEHPPVWVERALKITAGYGRKSLSYSEAILRGWVADGGPPDEPENVTRGRGKRDGAHERVHNKSPAKDRGVESSGEFAGLNVYEWIPPPGYTEDG